MPFYFAWIYRKGHSTKFFFRFSTLLSNVFAPYIQNLETCFAISVYFDFDYVCSAFNSLLILKLRRRKKWNYDCLEIHIMCLCTKREITQKCTHLWERDVVHMCNNRNFFLLHISHHATFE